MHASPVRPWSPAMRIVLIALSAIGALVCVVSAMTAIYILKEEGRVVAAVVVRAMGGGFWAVAALYLRRHPEWQAYLEEKF